MLRLYKAIYTINNKLGYVITIYGNRAYRAGCDEAGRGCLAGAVFAAAVILPEDFKNEDLNDSKQLSEKKRYKLRPVIGTGGDRLGGRHR